MLLWVLKVTSIGKGSSALLQSKKNGDIDTSHAFTGLPGDRADRVLDKIVDFAGSQMIFFYVDRHHRLGYSWYSPPCSNGLASYYAG